MKMKTITGRELKELAAEFDDDQRIIFSADYGDYHHTQQALPILGDVEEVLIEKSAYSASGFAIVDADREDDDDYEVYFLIR